MGYSKEEEQRIQETGSNNISRATLEWKAILEKAREEHKSCEGTSCEYDIHHAYRLVNEEVAQGIAWNKCANCGSPYRMDTVDAGGTVCSPDCHSEYLAALLEGW